MENKLCFDFFLRHGISTISLYSSPEWQNVKKLRETRADRRIAIFNKEACAHHLFACAVEMVDSQKGVIYQKIYNPLSSERISHYQTLVHILDLWNNMYQETLQEAFTLTEFSYKSWFDRKYNIIVEQEYQKADDRNWLVKRILI